MQREQNLRYPMYKRLRGREEKRATEVAWLLVATREKWVRRQPLPCFSLSALDAVVLLETLLRDAVECDRRNGTL